MPFAIAVIDEREDYGEERCSLPGMVEGQLLNVAYVERSGWIRLISARRTEPDQAAKAYLTVIAREPEIVRMALARQPDPA